MKPGGWKAGSMWRSSASVWSVLTGRSRWICLNPGPSILIRWTPGILLGSKGGLKLEPFSFHTTICDTELDCTGDLEKMNFRWLNTQPLEYAYASSEAHWIAALLGRVPMLPTAQLALTHFSFRTAFACPRSLAGRSQPKKLSPRPFRLRQLSKSWRFPMKRSEINKALKELEAMCRQEPLLSAAVLPLYA